MKGYTVCAYMRLSEEDRDIFGRKVESGSITSQRRLIMDFINRQPEFHGCNVIERCDDGISGRYFDTRPQFTDMIEQARKGKINCIIVKDCSRFGRDYVELGDYLEQLFPFLGVRFISINDHYDSDKCEGGLDIAFKNLVYEMYSRDLSKKVKESRRQMAQQGKYSACQTLYGYRKTKKDKHKLEKDPDAAAVVREIFDMRLSGMGLTEIAKNLNDREIPCRTIYKHDKGEPVNHTVKFKNMCWTSGSIYQLLTNDIYTGAVVSLKMEFDRLAGKQKRKPEEEWIRVEGMHEAIVSKEEFRQIQNMFQSQAPTSPYKQQHYRCGVCGRRLHRRNSGDLYCAQGYFLKEECECRMVKSKETYLDEIILKGLKAKLQRMMDAEELKLEPNADRASNMDTLYSLKRALEAVKKAKQILFEKLADRNIDRECFKEKKQAYDTEITELEQKISDADMAVQLIRDSEEGSAERIRTAKSFLEVAEMTEDMWEKFVRDVFLYPGDRIEIHWSFEG